MCFSKLLNFGLQHCRSSSQSAEGEKAGGGGKGGKQEREGEENEGIKNLQHGKVSMERTLGRWGWRSTGHFWPRSFWRRKEVEYPKGGAVPGCPWFRTRCCCWNITEPARSSGSGEVQPVSGPARGFGLRESHTGSCTGLCVPPSREAGDHWLCVNLPKPPRVF